MIDKPNEQSQACLSSAMSRKGARKRTHENAIHGTKKEDASEFDTPSFSLGLYSIT